METLSALKSREMKTINVMVMDMFSLRRRKKLKNYSKAQETHTLLS